MASAILGTWENTSNENFEEYLKAIGFGDVKRDSFPADAKGTTVFTENGGKLIQKNTVGPVTLVEFTFELGQEFEQDIYAPGGGGEAKKTKNVITLEGSTKLTHKATIDGVNTVTVREFNGDEMVAVSTAGEVTCTRKYKKVA